MKTIFLNKDNNIRNGWKILIFFVNFIVLLLLLNSSLSLFLPITDIFIGELIALISVVISTFLMMKFFEKKNFEDVGLRLRPNTIYEISFGLILGFIMITFVVVVNLTLGYYKYEFTLNQVYPQILKALSLFLLVAFFEEILFSGYPFQRLIDGTNPIIATLIFSLVFSLAHLQNPNVNLIALLNIFLAGVWLSTSYIKTRSLWLPISLHFSWNFFQGYFYSLPVSGSSLIEPIFNAKITSENIISGGKFGPEGSLITSLVLVASTIFITKKQTLE